VTWPILNETKKKEFWYQLMRQKNLTFILNPNVYNILSLILSLTHETFAPVKICLNVGKGVKCPQKVKCSWRKWHRQIQHTKTPYCWSFEFLSTKLRNFVSFTRRKVTDACLFVVVFFLEGDFVDPMVLEDQERVFRTKIKSCSAPF